MMKCMASSLLSLLLIGCAAPKQQQQADNRSRSRVRAQGPNLDRTYEWGSHVAPQGDHAMD
jgi:hypothetical protein